VLQRLLDFLSNVNAHQLQDCVCDISNAYQYSQSSQFNVDSQIKSEIKILHYWIYKNCHNFATALPIDVMFGSSMRFSGSADLMV